MMTFITFDWERIGATVADHLWQSTLCVGVAWLLTLAFRKNRASIRHWIWLAASLKFLVPFSLLIGLGTYFDFGWSAAGHANASEKSSGLVIWSRPLVAPAASVLGPRQRVKGSSTSFVLTRDVLLTLWGVGGVSVLFSRYGRGRGLRKLIGEARLLRQGRESEALQRVQSRGRGLTEVCLASSKSTIEPGVHGILHPVLLLPAGIADRLTDQQLEAILAHELAHIRRRDNLTAAAQVAVETVFWFHPLVWWIGTRMVEERERACDEDVLQSQTDPQVYAGAILTICDFYLTSPLTRTPGITGSNLKQRIEAIMLNKGTDNLNLAGRLLLVAAGTATLSLPILLGSMQKPTTSAVPTRLTFEVASIRLNPDQNVSEGMPPPPPSEDMAGGPAEGLDPDMGPPVIRIFAGGRLVATRATLRGIVRDAYPTRPGWRLDPWRIVGGPEWIRSAKYNIEAKAPNARQEQMLPMLQTLLADRFKLRLHWETRELPVYELTPARGGLKLEEWKEGSCISYPAGKDFGGPPAPPPPPPSPPGGGGETSRSAPGRQVKQPCGIYTMASVPPEMYALKTTISDFVPSLEHMLKRTILDKTSFKRTFNLHLVFDDSGRAGVPFETALQDQGGLKLESRRGPVSVLVIDSAERPSEN